MELKNYEEKLGLKAHLLGELEYFNPSGSVKDRAALNMILEAEKSGKLKPGGKILDFTSGNKESLLPHLQMPEAMNMQL